VFRVNVSIVIPARHAAQTIAETLDSVCAQTSGNWEAIVVDDGSTDETARIAAEFADRDSRITVISQPGAGESAARNTGIAHARYDWLLFLDADDWISPLHLERLTGELERHPELDAVHCGSVRVAPDGTQVSDNYVPPAGDLFPTLAQRAAFPVHACIVRRSLVEKVGRFDTSLRKSADWDLWQRIARAGARFGAVREVLAFYRMQPQSASMEAGQLLRDGLEVLRRGHGPDPRVPDPDPAHVEGAPPGEVDCQQFYLLCWCAGLLVGQRRDATELLPMLTDTRCAELYADAIARCLFEAAILPTCRTPRDWEALWPDFREHAERFLSALEAHSRNQNLANRSLIELKKLILKHSATWMPVIEEFEEALARQRALVADLERNTAGVQAARSESQRLVSELEQQKAALESEGAEWRTRASDLEHQRAGLESERNAWQMRAADLEQQVTAVESERTEWQQRALELDNRRTSLEQELQEAQRRSEQLVAEKAAFAAWLEDLESRFWIRVGRRMGMLQRQGQPVTPDTN
jgi:glycosyltransferase involved in cell wall biosynthesis